VEGGGCSGFHYDIKLDAPAEDDLQLVKVGEVVVIDEVSLPFLANAFSFDFRKNQISFLYSSNAASHAGEFSRTSGSNGIK